jgi:hypothetical protein
MRQPTCACVIATITFAARPVTGQCDTTSFAAAVSYSAVSCSEIMYQGE